MITNRSIFPVAFPEKNKDPPAVAGRFGDGSYPVFCTKGNAFFTGHLYNGKGYVFLHLLLEYLAVPRQSQIHPQHVIVVQFHPFIN